MKHRPVVVSLIAILAVCLVSMFAQVVRSHVDTVFNVNSTIDATDADPGNGVCETLPGNGMCTLRAAIQEANALGGDNTIVLPAGTYTITIAGAFEDDGVTGDLDIKSNVTLLGAGATNTIIDGGSTAIQDRVFAIWGPARVNISDVTIRNGDPGSFGGGGGIFINPDVVLTLSNSIVSNNRSYAGGGITDGGNLTIRNSTIISNSSSSLGGGGIHIGTGNAITITHSTIISNTSVNMLGGGIANYGTAVIDHSNIIMNAASNDAGGGIGNHGTLTLSNSIVSGNTSAYCGGIENTLAFADLTMINSTVNGNSSNVGGGGGICNDNQLWIAYSTVKSNSAETSGGGINNSGNLTLINSTVSSNTAKVDGGGIYNGDSFGSNVVNMNNVTIANNTADNDHNGTGDGGGVHNSLGNTINFRNTIVAGNTDSGGEGPDCSGTLTSQDYNLIQDTTGCTLAGATAHNITAQNPNLGPLQNNGGSTYTHALLGGSPAIDTGDNATCELTDQRGVSRPLDGDDNGSAICDIGAYEALFVKSRVYLPLVMQTAS